MIPIDPCGRAVDMLRSCYSTRMRFGTDPSQASKVQWYWCEPGAEALGIPTAFNSRNWILQDVWPALGEVQDVARTWRDGSFPVLVTGNNGPCGPPAIKDRVFRDGWKGTVPPNFPRNDFGLLPCCDTLAALEGEPAIGLMPGIWTPFVPPVIIARRRQPARREAEAVFHGRRRVLAVAELPLLKRHVTEPPRPIPERKVPMKRALLCASVISALSTGVLLRPKQPAPIMTVPPVPKHRQVFVPVAPGTPKFAQFTQGNFTAASGGITDGQPRPRRLPPAAPPVSGCPGCPLSPGRWLCSWSGSGYVAPFDNGFFVMTFAPPSSPFGCEWNSGTLPGPSGAILIVSPGGVGTVTASGPSLPTISYELLSGWSCLGPNVVSLLIPPPATIPTSLTLTPI